MRLSSSMSITLTECTSTDAQLSVTEKLFCQKFNLKCPKITITRLTLSYNASTAVSACDTSTFTNKDVSIAIESP